MSALGRTQMSGPLQWRLFPQGERFLLSSSSSSISLLSPGGSFLRDSASHRGLPPPRSTWTRETGGMFHTNKGPGPEALTGHPGPVAQPVGAPSPTPKGGRFHSPPGTYLDSGSNPWSGCLRAATMDISLSFSLPLSLKNQ